MGDAVTEKEVSRIVRITLCAAVCCGTPLSHSRRRKREEARFGNHAYLPVAVQQGGPTRSAVIPGRAPCRSAIGLAQTGVDKAKERGEEGMLYKSGLQTMTELDGCRSNSSPTAAFPGFIYLLVFPLISVMTGWVVWNTFKQQVVELGGMEAGIHLSRFPLFVASSLLSMSMLHTVCWLLTSIMFSRNLIQRLRLPYADHCNRCFCHHLISPLLYYPIIGRINL